MPLRSRKFIGVTVLLGMCGAARHAQATTITFESTITPANAGQPIHQGTVLDQYKPAVPGGAAFTTQGFTVNGVTNGVTGGSDTKPDMEIFLNPLACPGSPLATTCADNGTPYLASDQAWGLVPQSAGNFALHGFDAAFVFGPGGCIPCAQGAGIPNAATLTVTGFRTGAGQVAQQTFTLTSNFQPFLLDNDADWANITRAVFQGLTAAGAPGGIAGVDNLSVDAVPEPTSLLLLGTGIFGLAARRRVRRR